MTTKIETPLDLPDKGDDHALSYGYGYGYEELVDTFATSVALAVEDNDYQGDTRMILRNGDQWGLLIFGWGSCSGCDALQACSTMVEYIQLRNEMASDVQWYDTPGELLEYIEGKDWSLDWAWHAEETRSFLDQAKALLYDAMAGEKKL